jgi:ankyrin repeat protein
VPTQPVAAFETTELHQAALHNNVPIVRGLLAQADSGAMVNQVDGNGDTALIVAARHGFLEVVKLLLAHRDAILHNLVIRADANGDSPLHIAAKLGHTSVVDFLLRCRNVELNSADKQGRRPLHWAAMKGHAGVVETLLSQGANVQFQDETGKTPLHEAAFVAFEPMAWSRTAGNQMDVDEDKEEEARLERVERSVQIISSLMNRRLDVNAVDVDGLTPLHMAAMNERYEPAEALIELGNANINAITLGWGLTPLIVAIDEARFLVVDCLLTAGADVNLPDKEGNTPLHYAARKGFRQVVEGLLRKGADPTARNIRSEIPRHLVRATDRYKQALRNLLTDAEERVVRERAGQTSAIPQHEASGLQIVSTILQGSVKRITEEGAGSRATGLGDGAANLDAEPLLPYAHDLQEIKNHLIKNSLTTGLVDASRADVVALALGAYKQMGLAVLKQLDDRGLVDMSKAQHLLVSVFSLQQTAAPQKKDNTKVTNMEKAWWRLFFSRRCARPRFPSKTDVGANVLRQTALLEFSHLAQVREYVYFGANDKKEMGFHRTLVFSHFLYELVDKAPKATMEAILEYLTTREHSALKLLDTPGDEAAAAPIMLSKSIHICLPCEGYALETLAGFDHFKAERITVRGLTQDSTWDDMHMEVKKRLEEVISRRRSFVLKAPQLLEWYDFMFFLRPAWETENKAPVPPLKLSPDAGSRMEKWWPVVRRPYKIQENVVQEPHGKLRNGLWSMGVFLPDMEVFACFRPRAQGEPRTPRPVASSRSKAAAEDDDDDMDVDSAGARRGASRRRASRPQEPADDASASSSTKGKGPAARRRTRVQAQDLSAMPLGDFYSQLCFGDDNLGYDPNLADADTGDTLCHTAAALDDVCRVGLLVFFGADLHQRNRQQRTAVEVATLKDSTHVLEYIKWLHGRTPAGSGAEEDLGPASRGFLPRGTIFRSPKGIIYEVTADRPRDENDHKLIYPVKRQGSASYPVPEPLMLKLVEEEKELKRLREAAQTSCAYLVEEKDGFQSVYDVNSTAHDFLEEQQQPRDTSVRRWWVLVMPAYVGSLQDRVALAASKGQPVCSPLQLAIWG